MLSEISKRKILAGNTQKQATPKIDSLNLLKIWAAQLTATLGFNLWPLFLPYSARAEGTHSWSMDEKGVEN